MDTPSPTLQAAFERARRRTRAVPHIPFTRMRLRLIILAIALATLLVTITARLAELT